jgi:hypothetical protein
VVLVVGFLVSFLVVFFVTPPLFDPKVATPFELSNPNYTPSSSSFSYNIPFYYYHYSNDKANF